MSYESVNLFYIQTQMVTMDSLSKRPLSKHVTFHFCVIKHHEFNGSFLMIFNRTVYCI